MKRSASCAIALLVLIPVGALVHKLASAQEPKAHSEATPAYKRVAVPPEPRVRDLLSRMTLEEKARQLDLYSGATALINKRSDDTHAALDGASSRTKHKACGVPWASAPFTISTRLPRSRTRSRAG
jgi:hypothetical protein